MNEETAVRVWWLEGGLGAGCLRALLENPAAVLVERPHRLQAYMSSHGSGQIIFHSPPTTPPKTPPTTPSKTPPTTPPKTPPTAPPTTPPKTPPTTPPKTPPTTPPKTPPTAPSKTPPTAPPTTSIKAVTKVILLPRLPTRPHTHTPPHPYAPTPTRSHPHPIPTNARTPP
ncbi:uncharacterized protein LOC134763717 [Penaeus indicus]|uniref:uncharacterized protein LOC134763717 n=1 Tax=Penaeus indicus TaxID=29960 RepID=UPI00300CB34B